MSQHYHEHNPSPPLAPFVNNYWVYHNASSADQPYTILPDGFFDWVIISVPGKPHMAALYGICSVPIDVVVPAGAQVLGLAFRPLAVHLIPQAPLGDCQNTFKPFSLFDLPPVIHVDDFIALAESYLHTQLTLLGPPDERLRALCDWLAQTEGNTTVEMASAHCFWSPRQMNRCFNQWMGLPVKSYARILRCAAAYAQIRQGDFQPNLSFYDQPHFIKEIRQHTGARPKDLFKNQEGRFLQFSALMPG